MKNAKQERKYLLVLLFIGLFIRLIGVNQIMSGDELVWVDINSWDHWHPPLSITLHVILQAVFGASVMVSRLLIVCFGMANIYLVYLIADKLYNKRAAYWVALLMAFGAYPILASLQIDIDGAMLVFFYLLTTWFFLKFEKSGKYKWVVLSGIVFGLGLLTKFTGLFIIGILGLYHLIRERDLMKTIKVMLPIFVIGILIFSVFPLVSYLSGTGMFSKSLAHFSRYVVSGKINVLLLLIQYILPIIWLGPLFTFVFIIALKKLSKKDLLPLMWIFLIFVFYTFINKDNFKPLEKYFMVMIPPIFLIIGNYLSKIRFNKRHLIVFVMSFVAFFSIFVILNSMSGEFINFYPKQGFIQKAFSLDWNFFLPITGSSGPVGFYLKFSVVAYSFIVAGLLFLIISYLDYRKSRAWMRGFFVLLLAIGFAYNVFVMQEYLLSMTAPNVSKISKQVLDYAEDNNLQAPIYVFRNKLFKYHLKDKYGDVKLLDFGAEFDEALVEDMKNNASTVIVVDFPTINKESLLWEYLKSCELLQSFEDKGVTMGYIFDCTETMT